ncbi:hypothetical protein MUDAN_BIHEEGNE_00352 [Lactiplantibacillus mudanjiangensis]|uniref:hypothetical protein n=1 Tax=Lactiplantibacillus mudanjiangensis TaxID=1296538 RepID=UPI0010145E37|nr:hypothetical protein [Lactiplantibacillus mudanjiangensis]VDG17828.1 hypothetical protein MUDAN_BIHEEGNE_00352 [Lactiplantibacillus mudanjiangensis]VDG32474.1 hypothetical protein MUDAN_DOGOELCO_01731 [Lactiplantibacillus mudanjiangensis]
MPFKISVFLLHLLSEQSMRPVASILLWIGLVLAGSGYLWLITRPRHHFVRRPKNQV